MSTPHVKIPARNGEIKTEPLQKGHRIERPLRAPAYKGRQSRINEDHRV